MISGTQSLLGVNVVGIITSTSISNERVNHVIVGIRAITRHKN